METLTHNFSFIRCVQVEVAAVVGEVMAVVVEEVVDAEAAVEVVGAEMYTNEEVLLRFLEVQ